MIWQVTLCFTHLLVHFYSDYQIKSEQILMRLECFAAQVTQYPANIK